MMSNEGPKDLAARFSFKQPRSRRGRASVQKGSKPAPEPPALVERYTDHKLVQDLSPGDVFKGWYGRQVVLSLRSGSKGFVGVTYRKVRKDRSIIEAGEPIETTLKVGAPIRVLDHINIKTTGTEPEKESNTMAKTVTRKSGGAKPAAKKASTAAKPKSEGKARRSAADVDALVEQFVEHLQEGGTMRDLKKEHGFSDDGPIRAALYRNGYDSKGNTHEDEQDIDASKAAGKKQLVALRTEGAGWYVLAYRAGITEAEAKSIIEEAGGPTGRVYPPKAEKEAKGAKAKQTPAAKRKAAKAAAEDPS